MHDAIYRELQAARVTELRRRAEQDRRAREAARHWRHRAVGRVLAAVSAGRAGLRQQVARARPADERRLDVPANVSGAFHDI